MNYIRKSRKIKDNQNINKKSKTKSKKEEDNISKTNNKTKTRKSRLVFNLKIAAFFLLGVFFYFAFISTSNSDKDSVFQRLDILKQQKVPYLVVMRDDFSPVSEENKNIIENIVKMADDSLTVFDIYYDPNNVSKESEYFIDKFDIESLPVIILCDEKGEMINSYYLPFDEKQILGSVEKARESSVN